MILGFKKRFNSKIKSGSKIHTIRKGKRWKADMKIHFYNGVRTKKMKKFMDDGICKSVQSIIIGWAVDEITLKKISEVPEIYIDGSQIFSNEQEILAKNDGFSCYEDFLKFFRNDLEGQIINWTDYIY